MRKTGYWSCDGPSDGFTRNGRHKEIHLGFIYEKPDWKKCPVCPECRTARNVSLTSYATIRNFNRAMGL